MDCVAGSLKVKGFWRWGEDDNDDDDDDVGDLVSLFNWMMMTMDNDDDDSDYCNDDVYGDIVFPFKWDNEIDDFVFLF